MAINHVIVVKLPGAPDMDDVFIETTAAAYTRWAGFRPRLYGDELVEQSYRNTNVAYSRELANLIDLNPVNSANLGSRTFAFSPEMTNVANMFNTTRDLSVITDIGALIEPVTWDGADFTGAVPGSLQAHDAFQILQEKGQGAPIGFGVNGRAAQAIATVFSLDDVTRGKIAFNIDKSFIFGEAPFGAAITIPQNGNPVVATTISQYAHTRRPVPATVGDALNSAIIDPSTQARFAQYLQRATYTPPQNADILQDTHHDREVVINANLATIKTAFDTGVTVGVTPNYTPNSAYNDINTIVKTALRRPLLSNRPTFQAVQRVGGWDTHNSQADILPPLLDTLDDWLNSLRQELVDADLWDTTVVIIAGEFGRTWEENESGTDHAWRTHAFVMGGPIVGGTIFFGQPEVGEPAGPVDRRLDHPLAYKDRGRCIPRFDWSQMWAAVFQEIGISEAQMNSTGLLNNLGALTDYPGTTSPIIPWVA